MQICCMKKLLLIALLGCFSALFSQKKVIIGTVLSDSEVALGGTLVINLRTDEKTGTNAEGYFLIEAWEGDELRFVRGGYERKEITVTSDLYSGPLKLYLKPMERLIPELEIGFKPTGNLRKDIAKLETRYDRQVSNLNSNLNSYMRTPPKEVLPSNKTPSAFRAPDYSAGQMDIGKAIGALVSLISKASKEQPKGIDYTDRQNFYVKIKSVIDVEYFATLGYRDYDLDRLIAYADKRFSLAKKFHNNFNANAIIGMLKLAANDYKKIDKKDANANP